MSTSVLLQIKAAKLDDRTLLKIDAVSTLTGLSRTALYNKVEAGELAAPVRMGTRCTRWVAADVFAWLERKSTEAKSGPTGTADPAAAAPASAASGKPPGGAAAPAGKASE